jgi:carbonic anhydrase
MKIEMDPFLAGIHEFHRKEFRKNRKAYHDLAKHGQHPKALFIACSDSRVDPERITHSNPGDLFVVRNVGNLVHPYSSSNLETAVGAAIDYAVSVLKVGHIIVCGHSYCGACLALINGVQDTEMEHINAWLDSNSKLRDKMLGMKHQFENEDKFLRYTERASVLHQLENLLSYPSIFKRVEKDELTLHGWYFGIEQGLIEYYDPETTDFLPMEQT